MRALWAIAAFAPWIGAAMQVPLLTVLVPLEEGDRIPLPYTEIAVALLGLALGIAAIAAFVLHASRNPRLDAERRRTWILALVIANGVALPVYWWKYLRR